MGDKSQVLEAVLKETVDLVTLNIDRSESLHPYVVPCYVFFFFFLN